MSSRVYRRLVRAVAGDIGHLDEYARFLLDQQVNENGPRTRCEPEGELAAGV